MFLRAFGKVSSMSVMISSTFFRREFWPTGHWHVMRLKPCCFAKVFISFSATYIRGRTIVTPYFFMSSLGRFPANSPLWSIFIIVVWMLSSRWCPKAIVVVPASFAASNISERRSREHL